MQRHTNSMEPHGFVILSTTLAAGLWFAQSANIASAGPKSDESNPTISAVFSPDGGCARRIISEIKSARNVIRVQAYIFTSDRIADALIEAVEREVDVTVIFDASQKKKRYSRWKQLKKGGVKVTFDGEHATANNKIILIDDTTIITGSYNYSKAAESRNAENIVIIKNDKRLLRKYRENFEQHRDHSD